MATPIWNKMKPHLTVIKVGGAILEDAASTALLLDAFAALQGHKVLVHGGGRAATRIASQLGIESQMVDGRRITDAAMLDVVTMVYGGLVNKRTVAQLQARGVNAMGLTGADMNVLQGHKRPVRTIDYGWVGDVDSADGQALASLIRQGVVPVMAPLIHDGQGHMLNTNADTIASQVAIALAQHFQLTLTFCFEKPGVLRHADDDSSAIPHITPTLFSSLTADGTISGGMLPKLENAFQALRQGVSRVLITRADDLQAAHGTLISQE